jgi:hypothetical protein
MDHFEEGYAQQPPPAAPDGASSKRTFTPHPLFPREDDLPEDRNIRFITFKRLNPDGTVQSCPEDIPCDEVRSWKQVVEWWGGGSYRAIGKDERHCYQAMFPLGRDAWEKFDGDPKPFVARGAQRPAPAPPAPLPPSPPNAAAGLVAAPSPLELSIAELRQAVARLVAAPPAPPAPASSGSEMMIAMMTIQAENARAQTAAQATVEAARIDANCKLAIAQETARAENARAQAAAQAETTRLIMSVLTQRTPEDPLKMLTSVMAAAKQMAPAPVPVQGIAEQLSTLKTLQGLAAPAAGATPSGYEPLVDLASKFLAADVQAKQALATAQASRPAESPHDRTPPARERERGLVGHVPGLGVVEVMVPEVKIAALAPAAPPLLPAISVQPAPAAATPAPAPVAPHEPAAPAVLEAVRAPDAQGRAGGSAPEEPVARGLAGAHAPIGETVPSSPPAGAAAPTAVAVDWADFLGRMDPRLVTHLVQGGHLQALASSPGVLELASTLGPEKLGTLLSGSFGESVPSLIAFAEDYATLHAPLREQILGVLRARGARMARMLLRMAQAGVPLEGDPLEGLVRLFEQPHLTPAGTDDLEQILLSVPNENFEPVLRAARTADVDALRAASSRAGAPSAAPAPAGATATGAAAEPSAPAPAATSAPSAPAIAERPPAAPAEMVDDSKLALGALSAITKMPLAARAAALRKLPGLDGMADELAKALGDLPHDHVQQMVRNMPRELLGALAHPTGAVTNGIAGGK